MQGPEEGYAVKNIHTNRQAGSFGHSNWLKPRTVGFQLNMPVCLYVFHCITLLLRMRQLTLDWLLDDFWFIALSCNGVHLQKTAEDSGRGRAR